MSEYNLEKAFKDDSQKPRMELLPPKALEEIAKAFTYGANKYSDHNWRKGFKWQRLIGASMRHLSAFTRGENVDPESNLPHLAHLGASVMMLIEHYTCNIGEDDRYK